MSRKDLTDILLEDLCKRAKGPLTQQQIADAVGLTQQHVSRIEAGALQKLRAALSEADVCDPDMRDILSHLSNGDGN